jgi:hypothetical protein
MLVRQATLGYVIQLVLNGTPGVLSAQLPDTALEAALRRVVAAQATSDLALISQRGGGAITPNAVAISAGPTTGSGIRTWRATVWSMSHWPPYLLASRDSGPIRLGGFPAPELQEVFSGPRRQSLSADDVAAFARDLAVLLDPNGAEALVFPAAHDSSSRSVAVVARWKQAKPATWPGDAIVAGEDGGYSIRLTALSKETWTQGEPWLPIAYSFEIGPGGQVLGWAKRLGEPFAIGGHSLR